MKNIIIFLFPLICFSCIPMEEDPLNEYLDILIHNKSSQLLFVNFDYEFKPTGYNGHCKIDSLASDSTKGLTGTGYEESIRDIAFSVFRKNYIHKHLSIYNVNGDTLANLSDTSFVFNDQQYWTIETNTGNEFVHCILQLTDDILELK